LFHEGGHAAHFANVTMDAPCFSQEYAPTSVALAETRYAHDAAGQAIPWRLIQRGIELTQPFAAQDVRNMLAVCYAEKALYELDDADLAADNVLRVLRETEQRVLMLPGGRPFPTLALPHLLSSESSAYYHGYVLAQMAVVQTRAHFRERYGYLLDNPSIGNDLAATYWAPGNSRGFLDLVKDMTGRPFAADALVAEVSRPVDVAIRDARDAVERSESIPRLSAEPELDLRLSVIHGGETIVEPPASPLEVAERFRAWLVR
jgi:hypothetical protein